MKFTSIQLCNFRQFYGKTPEIVLASGNKNTTIIHGNNGAGKTTLLNAFTWVMYEKFSAAFASIDKLVNKRAITVAKLGEPVECWVQVAFEHDSKLYRVKRLYRVYKSETIEYSRSELSLYVAGDDGRWLLPQQLPEDIIGRILPETLHQYFFFDGERIDHIARYDKKAEIAEATKELLGVKVLNRSIEHLKNTKKTLEYDLKAIGDSETKKLLREQEKLEQESERLSKRQNEISNELEYQEELKRTIGSRLLELSGTEELQHLRNELEQQRRSLREQIKKAKDIVKRVISTRGYTVLLLEATVEFRAMVRGLRERGELPTGIKQQFVRDLLNERRCICGAELIEETNAHTLVRAWMDKAGSSDVEETAIRMGAQVDEIDKQAPEFWNEVDRQQANINQCRIEIAKTETQLDDLKERIRSYPNEDIQQLQKRFDETEELSRELILEQGANGHQVESLTNEILVKIKQIAKHKMNQEKQALAQRRIIASQDAIERLIQVRTLLEQHFRLALEKRVQEIFGQISFTPYLPKLNDRYELALVENTAGQEVAVAASTGENQILSLSFIGSIIDRVREWSQNKMLMGPDSSTYPVIMDSPFGSLDEIYRRRIAKTIPKLANQLIVLVTKTQWRGEVAEEMAPYVGKEYILVYNSPKPNCEDTIFLGGEHYPLVKQSPNEFEYSEILEVSDIF